jgi:hypothetical protein
MNSIEIRERLKEPNAHFNPDEIKLIDEHYLELDYLSIYKSLYTIHYFFREYGLVQEPEYAHKYDDFGIESWEESRLFAIKLINTGKYKLDELISLISVSFKIPEESIRGERKFLILIKNTINLSCQFNIFLTGQTLPYEITALIEKRIDTIAYSYLEMVDVFNFIDFANIAFLGRLNEYDSYPARVWKQYDVLNSKDDVSKVLIQIFDEMFGFTPNMEADNPDYHYFINVCNDNEHLRDKLKGLTLLQRLDIGAQMILDIKDKYPYLGKFYFH